MSKPFQVRAEVELPVPPEEVWQAVTSGAGTAAWLWPGEDPEPRVGGAAFGGHVVTAWDPPHHWAVRAEGEDGWFNALEAIIEARAGGTAVLRWVHSGVFVDDWDTQYDAVNRHTDFYLHTLREYLTHFRGRPATFIGIDAPPETAALNAAERMRQALGLGPDAAVGRSVRVEVHGVAALEGVLDYLTPHFVGIRTADGLYRFFGRDAFGGPSSVSLHLFADADREQTERAWRAWLDAVLA